MESVIGRFQKARLQRQINLRIPPIDNSEYVDRPLDLSEQTGATQHLNKPRLWYQLHEKDPKALPEAHPHDNLTSRPKTQEVPRLPTNYKKQRIN